MAERRTFLEAPVPEDSQLNRDDVVDALKKLGLGAVIEEDRLKVQVDVEDHMNPVDEVAVRAVIQHLLKLEIDEEATHRVNLDEEL